MPRHRLRVELAPAFRAVKPARTRQQAGRSPNAWRVMASPDVRCQNSGLVHTQGFSHSCGGRANVLLAVLATLAVLALFRSWAYFPGRLPAQGGARMRLRRSRAAHPAWSLSPRGGGEGRTGCQWRGVPVGLEGGGPGSPAQERSCQLGHRKAVAHGDGFPDQGDHLGSRSGQGEERQRPGGAGRGVRPKPRPAAKVRKNEACYG